MELEGSDKSKTRLKPGSAIEFGRDHGLSSSDRTVSRRHVSLRMEGHKGKSTVYFEVVGRNPMWVYSHNTGRVEVFRRFDRGEIANGDMFCVSAKNPIWFTLKRADFEEENEPRELGLEIKSAESIEPSSHEAKMTEELDTESVDMSSIDPVEEFGLVVLGHEFDGFQIRDPQSWNWYIEEPSEDDDVEGKKGKKNRRRKKKGGVENDDDDDDEEWSGEEGEDEKASQPLTKLRKVGKPAYATRSQDRTRTSKEDGRKGVDLSGRQKSAQPEDEDAEDEDEDDETLGGFIVDDVPEEEYQMDLDDDEEEEEFIEDEDEE